MKTIPLTRGYNACVDDVDYSRLVALKWCVKPHGRTAYAIRSIRVAKNKRTTIYMHHLILGFPLNDKEIDHIDGNGLNNTKKNLRIVSRLENAQNLHQPKSSRVAGVIWDKSRSKWQARKEGKLLGRFNTEKEAINAVS